MNTIRFLPVFKSNQGQQFQTGQGNFSLRCQGLISSDHLAYFLGPSCVGECLSLLFQEFKFHGAKLTGPLQALKKSGSSGRWTSNIQRDVFRKLGRDDQGQVSWLHSGSGRTTKLLLLFLAAVKWLREPSEDQITSLGNINLGAHYFRGCPCTQAY